MSEKQPLQPGRGRCGVTAGSVEFQPVPSTNDASLAGQAQRPAFIELRDGKDLCLLCLQWGSAEHYLSEYHASKVRYYQQLVGAPDRPEPALGPTQSAADYDGSSATPDPPAGRPEWYRWDAERWAWFCTLCSKYADEKHKVAAKHLSRAAWAEKHGWVPQPPPSQLQSPPMAQPPRSPPRQKHAPLETPDKGHPPPLPQHPPPPPSPLVGIQEQQLHQPRLQQPWPQPDDSLASYLSRFKLSSYHNSERDDIIAGIHQLPQAKRPEMVQQGEPCDRPRGGSKQANALPCDWERVQADDGSGVYVFHNTTNGETKCELPAGVKVFCERF